jgi:hypothetical protein
MRRDPEDVDLVNFCDWGELNALSAAGRTNARQLLNGREVTKTNYDAHAFLVVKFPAGHPLELTFEPHRQYWRQWFATPQDYSGPAKSPAPSRGRKGIVQMHAGDAKDCVVVEPS